MATFEETVLALSPLLFWRCKDLTGSQITDYSSNNYHGTVISGSAILGQPSGVETDSEARSVYLPGGFANSICELDPVPAPLLFTGNFTIACFVRHQETAGLQYLMGRGGLAGSTGSGLHFFTSGSTTRTLQGRIVTAGGADEVTAGSSYVLDAHQFVTFTRNGSVLQLRVNGALVGQNAAASTNPLEVDPGHDLVFGAAGNNLAPLLGWASELVICDYAWTSAQIQEVYESAINALLLSGVSNVIPTAVLYSDIEPTPVSFPFRHNWADSLIERITFRTARSIAVKGYESGNQSRPKPRRELELRQVLRDNDERESFRAKLTAQQNRKWFIPILEDREQLAAPLAAGATVMPATVQYRDYEVGGWVELRQLDQLGHVVKIEQVQITSLPPLTTTAIVNSYDALVSTISPARRGIVEAQVSPRGHTDAVEEVSLVVRLIAEDEKVAPNRIATWTPTISYKSYEVFDPAVWQSNDWSELRDYSVERERTEIDFDTGTFTVESDALAATESFSYRMLLEGRDKHAALLGWFYARAGASSYLWVPTMQRNFNIVSVTGSDLTVSGHHYFDNFAGSEFRRDLAFIYHDNTMALRRIVSVALAGVNETLTLDSGVPTQANLRSVSYLRFCRCDGDTLEIARVTDNKAYFAWGFREVLSSPA
jgi:Concanavalin A-like lectin/glucanases superfamily